MRAQAELARHFATGYGGFAKDTVQARAWCQRAANGGDVGSAEHVRVDATSRAEGGPVATDEGLAWLAASCGATITALA